MAFIFSNKNPQNNSVGDCVVRAISEALNQDWYRTYIDLAIKGFEMADMPSSNRVWMEYLKEQGWQRRVVPDDCPACYSVKDFCGEYFKGTYILGTGTHVIAVKDGDYIDTWDSGNEYPVYYWQRRDDDDT